MQQRVGTQQPPFVRRRPQRRTVATAAGIGVALLAVTGLQAAAPDTRGFELLYGIVVAAFASAFGPARGALAALVVSGLHNFVASSGSIDSDLIRIAGYLAVGTLAGILARDIRDADDGRLAHLAAVVDQSDAAVMSMTLPDAELDSWNRGAATLFGYAAEDAIGQNIAFLVPPALRDEAAAAAAAVLRGERVTLRTRRLCADGTEVDVSLQVSPLTAQDGRVTGATAIALDISAETAGLLALQRADEHFRGAFAHAPSGMAFVSLSPNSFGRVLQVNRALCQLSGYSEVDLLRGDLSRLGHPDEPDELTEALLECDQNTWAVDRRLLRADGETIWVRLTSSVTRGADGDALYGIAQIQDVTDQRAVARARAQLAAIINSTSDAVLTKDTAGVVQSWNPAAEALYGYRADEAIGRHISMIASPGRTGEQDEIMASALDGRSLSGLQTQRMTKGGNLVDISLTSSPVRDEEGHISGVSLIARDTTKETAARDALRSSELRLRQLVETANEGIWTVDENARTTFANQKMADILGTTATELLASGMYDFSDDNGRAEIENLLESKDGDGRQRQVCFTQPDGTAVWTLVSTSPLALVEGKPAGTLAMVADISGVLKAEEERRDLERLVHHAERLDSVGQLAGGVAHDMNNLLGIIINFSDFGLDAVADGPGSVELQEIRGAADRAATLVQQLLLFARQDVAEPEIVDANALLREMEGLLRGAVGEQIELHVNYGEAIPTIAVDPGLITQIVMNLAVNAKDAMPDGGTLQIATSALFHPRDDMRKRPALEPGDYACLSVSDTGDGMPEAVSDRAFDPFFTTKPRGSGTGLGLATVYGAAVRSGGSAQITSEVGRGTVVTIYLPAVSGVVKRPQNAGPTTPVLGHGAKVLLVEDDDGVRALARRILQEDGYVVVAATRPSEALALVEQQGEPVDLLLTDVVMPEMSGPKLAARLRRSCPDLPVVFVSGYTERPADMTEGEQFLAKPFTREELLLEVGVACRLEVVR